MSSKKNKKAREELEKIYGKGCFFARAKLAERLEQIDKELSFKKGDTYLYYGEIYEGVSFYLKTDIDSTLFDEAISEFARLIKNDGRIAIMDYKKWEEKASNVYATVYELLVD